MTALSLRLRLTIWYAVTLIVVLSLAAAFVFWQQQRLALRRVDRELADLDDAVINVFRDEIREATPNPAREAIVTLGVRDRAIAILDEAGTVVAATWNGFESRDNLASAATQSARTTPTGNGNWRVLVNRHTAGTQNYRVLTAISLADVEREQQQLLGAMAIGIPIAVLLAALGGLWLASVGLRPITEMARDAARISATGSEDLGPSARHDELGQLTRAFNGLVARLRTALEAQRQFMADASHELRTPVSVIRSAADVTLSRAHRDEPEYREALTIVDAEARRAARLVDDMLVLARADSGGYPLKQEPMYIDELVTDCTRALALLAGQRNVTLHASAPSDSSVDGDPELLRRMLVNVVQNAVQHSGVGTEVGIDVMPNGSRVTIDVTNVGTPIPAADSERIFERFVQLDAARRASGSGLGLPIARWIAEAHGGTLTLKRSSPAATTFSISLPLS